MLAQTHLKILWMEKMGRIRAGYLVYHWSVLEPTAIGEQYSSKTLQRTNFDEQNPVSVSQSYVLYLHKYEYSKLQKVLLDNKIILSVNLNCYCAFLHYNLNKFYFMSFV